MVYFINIQRQLSHSVWQTLAELGQFDESADTGKVMSDSFAVTLWYLKMKTQHFLIGKDGGKNNAKHGLLCQFMN